jgi:hypothetical protein
MQRSPGALADASMQEAPAHAEESFGRRQRRRMEGSMVARSAAAGSTHGGGDVALSPAGSSSSKAYPPSGGAGASVSSDDEAEEEALREAVGQLSLNEDEQVRWHGKASGLHLLSDKARLDTRNEGGIWLACFLTSLCLSLLRIFFAGDSQRRGSGHHCRGR